MGAEQSQLGLNGTATEDDKIGITQGLSSISFKINGKLHSVDVTKDLTINSGTRLVDFIRGRALLKGTKFMCREGGCGACVVSITSKDAAGQNVVKSGNSCLIPLLSCDGWDISTIEHLGNAKSGYHALQTEMAKTGGTQCGFCTPGMIMHMYSLTQNGKPLKAKEIEDCLDGNICRCTGYRPILDAFKHFATDTPKELLKKYGSCDIEEAHATVCPLKLGLDSNVEDEAYELIMNPTGKSLLLNTSSEVWIKAVTLQDAFSAINQFVADQTSFRIVAGNTSTGIYKNDGPYTGFIDIRNIPTLTQISVSSTEVVLGSCTTISNAISALKTQSTASDGYSYLGGICQHMKRIGNTSVRNVGTLAGNLMIRNSHHEFPSDLFTILETVGAELKIATHASTSTMFTVKDFFKTDMNRKLIVSIHLKPLRGNYIYRSYKVAKRYQNAHAIVNAGFLFNVDKTNSFTITDKPSIVFGGISSEFIHAENTETALSGKSLQNNQAMQNVMTILAAEIKPDTKSVIMESADYRKLLAQSLLYKAILSILGTSVKPNLQSGGKNLKRGLTSGMQTYDTDSRDWPLNKPIPKLEAAIQCSGEAQYINDIHPLPNELVGIFVLSTVGNADIESVNAADALKDPDIVAFIQASDIPGTNDYMIGSAGTPEPIFAKDKVGHAGQPIGVIVGKNESAAIKAAKLVNVVYKNVKKPILTIKDALKPTLAPPTGELRIVTDPPVPPAPAPSIKIKGEFEIGSQYHFHMETQICICEPRDDGGMDVTSSTQWMDFVQNAVAGALALPNHDVNVQVRRLGGAFGSKLSRAAHVAAACSVAAHVTNAPVRIALDLQTNMEMIGKRAPYLIQYEVGVDDAGKILGMKTMIACDAGMFSNEETAAGAKYFMQNCYDNSKWEIEPKSVFTNTASNTWCRAPGTTQGIAIIEYLMEHIAFAVKKDPLEVRKINFSTTTNPGNNPARLTVGELMRGTQERELSAESQREPFRRFQTDPPVPPQPQETILQKMINQSKTDANFDERVKAVEEYNKNNRWKKRGIAMIPMKYPLAYGGGGFPIFLSIYKIDGTISLSYGGIEMGQGINTKVVQTVARQLGVGIEKIRVKPANNLIGANADSTGGSSTSELCCYAASMACQILNQRMKPVRDKVQKDIIWEDLIYICAKLGLDLSASYMYSKNDPVLGYDIWAVNITEVEIDVLTGEYKVDPFTIHKYI